MDESRHARTMAALARRHGAVVAAPRLGRGPARSLLEVAVENAVEGCVRETWGALSAAYSARAAADRAVRRAMAAIADDEARHAELAWAIDRWAAARLAPAERRLVEHARTHEAARLRAHLAAEPPVAVAALAGLPDAERACMLAGALAATLWT
jgi:hypothetical protein